MNDKIICYSVKTTIHIGTKKEVSVHDAFYLYENGAKNYVEIQKSMGNKPDKPWGKFKVEIIPLVNIIPSPCTPEQYQELTGKPWPDDAAVYYRTDMMNEWEIDCYYYYLNNVKPRYFYTDVLCAIGLPPKIGEVVG